MSCSAWGSCWWDSTHRIQSPAGTVPARSMANGPSPSSALFTSTTLPFTWMPIEVPPPMWATIRVHSA